MVVAIGVVVVVAVAIVVVTALVGDVRTVGGVGAGPGRRTVAVRVVVSVVAVLAAVVGVTLAATATAPAATSAPLAATALLVVVLVVLVVGLLVVLVVRTTPGPLVLLVLGGWLDSAGGLRAARRVRVRVGVVRHVGRSRGSNRTAASTRLGRGRVGRLEQHGCGGTSGGRRASALF
jgi:hypothetical protein